MAEPISLPMRFRPFGARMATALAAAVLVAASAFLWLMLSSDVRAQFTLPQRLTLLAFLAAVLGGLYAIYRTNALADDSGLTVVNGFRRRRFAWPEVVRVTLTPNRPWALLDLAHGDTVSVMAIQVSDGARARRAADALARILAQQSATERDD